jgi:hypothetical protein
MADGILEGGPDLVRGNLQGHEIEAMLVKKDKRNVTTTPGAISTYTYNSKSAGRMPKAKLTTDQRRALAVIAGAGQCGATETLLVDVYSFGLAELAQLVYAGFATLSQQTMRGGGRTITVVRMRITDTGRRALIP